MNDNLVDLNVGNFSREVTESNLPYAVLFKAEWAAPCRYIIPIFDELGGEYSGRVKFGMVDTDNNPELAG